MMGTSSSPVATTMTELALTRRRWLALSGGAAAAAMLPSFGVAAEEPLSPRAVEKNLVWHDQEVPNAEPELDDLVADWTTPIKHFYVRSHAPAPKIDLGSFRLTVGGLVERPLSLSLAELLGLDQTSAVTTLTCAGNRRIEHNAVETISGVQWRAGAIGNTEWSGIPLATILKQAGLKDSARHVWFQGLDEIEKGGRTIGFGGSIPVQKALADHDGTPGALVAMRMGGEPLAADHGFPVRTIVPGYIGARSVKWLGHIEVAAEPSPNHYVSGAYRLVQRDDPLAWIESSPIYNYAINSYIATIKPSKSFDRVGAAWDLVGYALPPGDGRSIAKVELTTDGENWSEAKITSDQNPFCWVLWKATVRVRPEAKSFTVRATDSDGRVQPETVPWNLKGYMYNAWHTRPLPNV